MRCLCRFANSLFTALFHSNSKCSTFECHFCIYFFTTNKKPQIQNKELEKKFTTTTMTHKHRHESTADTHFLEMEKFESLRCLFIYLFISSFVFSFTLKYTSIRSVCFFSTSNWGFFFVFHLLFYFFVYCMYRTTTTVAASAAASAIYTQ